MGEVTGPTLPVECSLPVIASQMLLHNSCETCRVLFTSGHCGEERINPQRFLNLLEFLQNHRLELFRKLIRIRNLLRDEMRKAREKDERFRRLQQETQTLANKLVKENDELKKEKTILQYEKNSMQELNRRLKQELSLLREIESARSVERNVRRNPFFPRNKFSEIRVSTIDDEKSECSNVDYSRLDNDKSLEKLCPNASIDIKFKLKENIHKESDDVTISSNELIDIPFDSDYHCKENSYTSKAIECGQEFEETKSQQQQNKPNLIPAKSSHLPSSIDSSPTSTKDYHCHHKNDDIKYGCDLEKFSPMYGHRSLRKKNEKTMRWLSSSQFCEIQEEREQIEKENCYAIPDDLEQIMVSKCHISDTDISNEDSDLGDITDSNYLRSKMDKELKSAKRKIERKISHTSSSGISSGYNSLRGENDLSNETSASRFSRSRYLMDNTWPTSQRDFDTSGNESEYTLGNDVDTISSFSISGQSTLGSTSGSDVTLLMGMENSHFNYHEHGYSNNASHNMPIKEQDNAQNTRNFSEDKYYCFPKSSPETTDMSVISVQIKKSRRKNKEKSILNFMSGKSPTKQHKNSTASSPSTSEVPSIKENKSKSYDWTSKSNKETRKFKIGGWNFQNFVNRSQTMAQES